jgi:hypothetical protein
MSKIPFLVVAIIATTIIMLEAGRSSNGRVWPGIGTEGKNKMRHK